jgi:hypothetical protein
MSDTIIVVEQDRPPDTQSYGEQIRQALEAGQSAQVVAARLNLDPAAVLAVADELKARARAEVVGTDKLHHYLRDLDDIVEIAQWQARAEPSPTNIYAYTALIETARGLMQDIDGRRDPKKLRDDLVDRVLRVMIAQTIGAMTSRLAATRLALVEITPAERHPEVTIQIENVMRALGAVMHDELTAAIQSVEKLLDEKPAAKSTAMVRRKQGAR